MAGVFPESEGSQPVTDSGVNASCEVREYGDCYRIIDTSTLDAISKEIAHAVNACDNNQYECGNVTNLKETLECIIGKIPDICGAPTVADEHIVGTDYVVICVDGNLKRINIANFKDEIQDHPCTLPLVTETGITDADHVLVCDNNVAKRMTFGDLKDEVQTAAYNPCTLPLVTETGITDIDHVLVCDDNVAKRMTFGDLKNELGGDGGLVAMAFREAVGLDPEMNGSGFNVQSVQLSVQPGKGYELTFINPPPAGRYMFVTHLTEADIPNNENPLLAPQYITYSGSGPIDTPFPLNFHEDFFFYIYGPITDY